MVVASHDGHGGHGHGLLLPGGPGGVRPGALAREGAEMAGGAGAAPLGGLGGDVGGGGGLLTPCWASLGQGRAEAGRRAPGRATRASAGQKGRQRRRGSCKGRQGRAS